MQKNIFTYNSLVIALSTVCLEILAIATPIQAQIISNNFALAQDIQIVQNTSDDQESSEDNLGRIILLTGLIGIGSMFWRMAQSRQRANSSFRLVKSKSETALLDRVSPKLKRQLLRLINDPKTVNRLLMGIYKDNSHRSPNWIAEKAIYDLRRGR